MKGILLNNYQVEDRIKVFAGFATIFFTSFNTFFASILNLVGINPHPVTVFLALLFFGSTIGFAIISIGRINSSAIILLLVFVLIFILSVLIFSENREYLFGNEIVSYTWLRCIPVFICFSTLRKSEDLFYSVNRISYIVIVLQTFISIAGKTSNGWVDRSNYMEIAYQILLPVCFLLLKRNKQFVDYIFIATGAFIIFFEGARGAVFALLICVSFWFLTKFKGYKLIFFLFVAFFTVFIIYLNLDSVIKSVIEFAMKRGLNGHLIRTMQSNQVFVSDGRMSHYKVGLDLIANNWFFGCGLGGDRYYLKGVYVHNVILEVLIQVGILWGVLFFCWFAKITKRMFNMKNEETKNVCLALFFSMGFLKLLLSSSYVLEPSFYAMLALVTNRYLRVSKVDK